MKKILVLLCLVFSLVSCANKNIYVPKDNAYFAQKYGEEAIAELPYYLIHYVQLSQMIEDKFTGIIIFSRDDCKYCHTLMNSIVEMANDYDDLKINALYFVETSEMNSDEKKELTDKYMIDSVPSIILFKEGKLKRVETGTFTKEILYKLQNEL